MAALKLYNLLCCSQTISKIYLHNGIPRYMSNPLNVSLRNGGKGGNKKNRGNEQNKRINKIMTWNIQELFWYSNKSKMERIAQYIKQSDCDVVCLQEVFEISSLERLLYDKDIIQKYPFSITGNMKNKYLFGENSGLFVLSNQPIRFIKYVPLIPCEIPDSFASKGIIYFKIGLHKFAVTHLQAFNEHLAEQQLRLVRDSSPFGLDFILLGDLNHSSAHTCLRCKKNNYEITCPDSNKILDYILFLDPDRDFDMNITVGNIDIDCKSERMSDQRPVSAEFS